jgi:hypothetical protein
MVLKNQLKTQDEELDALRTQVVELKAQLHQQQTHFLTQQQHLIMQVDQLTAQLHQQQQHQLQPQ